MKQLLLIAALAGASPAVAHDTWANGDKVPDWVKASCCGPADAHHLRPDQVHDMGDWYEVDGYTANGGKISHRIALPSQDGEYWIFYQDYPGGKSCSPFGGCSGTMKASQSNVYCFFVPMAF